MKLLRSSDLIKDQVKPVTIKIRKIQWKMEEFTKPKSKCRDF